MVERGGVVNWESIAEELTEPRQFGTIAQGLPYLAYVAGGRLRCHVNTGGKQSIEPRVVDALLAEMQLLPAIEWPSLIKSAKERYALPILIDAIARQRPSSYEAGITPSVAEDAKVWEPELVEHRIQFRLEWLADAFRSIRQTVLDQIRIDGPQRILPGEEWRRRPHTVYVLRIPDEAECYYVGHSKDYASRVMRHRTGRGAVITRELGVDDLMGTATLGNQQQAFYAERFLYRAIKKTGRRATMGLPASNVSDRRTSYGSGQPA